MSGQLGVCLLAAIPGRSEASDRSEMVTQLLFGEYYEVLEEQEKWLRVRCLHDNYECWIDRGQYRDSKLSTPPTDAELRTVLDPINYLKTSEEALVPIVAGARLPVSNGNTLFSLCDQNFEVAHQMTVGPIPLEQLVSFGKRLLNTPYLWGGRSAFGVDCSGLSQLLYRALDIQLPRDSSQQIEVGSSVSSLRDSKSGDLAFFKNDAGKIFHVGMLLDTKTILHASSMVKIEQIDEEGIMHERTGKHTHRLCEIRRVI